MTLKVIILNFVDIFERIKACTPLSNQADLAVFLEIAPTQISKQKKKDNFPLEWTYKIASDYDLSIDWILKGDVAANKSKDDFFLQLENWGKESSGSNDISWLKNQIENAFPMFKEWKKRKEEQESETDTSADKKIA